MGDKIQLCRIYPGNADCCGPTLLVIYEIPEITRKLYYMYIKIAKGANTYSKFQIVTLDANHILF